MQLLTQNGSPASFTQGDNAVLQLIAVDDQGNPVDLTGASLSTEILGPNGSGVVTFPNSQHAIPSQSGSGRGKFSLTLAQADTANCGEGAAKQILTMATITAVLTTYRGVNILTVYPAVPLQ